jgi:hypothetical protein
LFPGVFGCAQSVSINGPAPINGGAFNVYKSVVTDTNGIPFFDEEAIVSLYDSGILVSGGAVTIDSMVIPPWGNTIVSYQLDSASGQSVPILLNGAQVVFSVSGSSQYPPLRDSVTFPNRDMKVTAPTAGATVSKSAGFSVTWDYVPNSSDSIELDVVKESTGGNTIYNIADNGSFMVPASALSVFNTGDWVLISMYRHKITYGVDKLGHQYDMEAWSKSSSYHRMFQ